MHEPFRFQRRHRSLGSFLVLCGVWAALGAAWFFLDAAPLLLVLVGAATLPLLWDLVRNPPAGLALDDKTLSWRSGRHTAEIALAEIAQVRLDTRLDFSVRVTLRLNSGRKIRIPFEATPPHRAFEAALSARGLKTERQHFSLRQ